MNTDVMQRLLCLICSDGDFVPDKSGLANRIFSTLQRMMQGRHTIEARVPCVLRCASAAERDGDQHEHEA